MIWGGSYYLDTKYGAESRLRWLSYRTLKPFVWRRLFAGPAFEPHFCILQGDLWGFDGWSLQHGSRANRWDTTQ